MIEFGVWSIIWLVYPVADRLSGFKYFYKKVLMEATQPISDWVDESGD